MRILFVTGGIPSPLGQNYLLDLLKTLSAAHQFTVVSCDLEEPYLPDSDDELHRLARVTRVPLPRRSLISRAIRSLFSLTPVAVQAFHFDALRDAVAAAFPDTGYDLVVFEQLVTGQYAYLAGGAPKLLFPVDAVSRLKWQRFLTAVNPVRKLAYALDSWMTKRYENRIYSDFDGVLLVSDADAAYVLANRQMNASKVFVLTLASDTDYFTPRPSEPGNAPSLVFLGNMFNPINEDAILWFHRSVWGQLKRQIPELRLDIVGNNPNPKVKRLASEDASIIVTGYLRDIRPPVWNATVFVSPLRMGVGIKTKILQAMAMGKAIVATPLSVESLNVEDGREVLLARDAEEFFERIVFLLRNPRERERLSREARQFVERNHSLENNASRFLRIVECVLASKENPSPEIKTAFGRTESSKVAADTSGRICVSEKTKPSTNSDRRREQNQKLNHRFFPQGLARYADRFRELADLLSRNTQLVVHLGAGAVDLEASLKPSSPKPRLLNLDLSLEALRENPGNLKVCGNAEALPLSSSSVDLICAEHVFEHFPQPLPCLQECFRVLRSGGNLVVSGPNGRSYIALAARLTPLNSHNLVRRLAQGSNGRQVGGFPTFYRFSSPRAMCRLARQVGFETVSIETFVGEPCYTTFLPLVHVAFIAYHLLLEKLRPLFNFHLTAVAVFRKPLENR